MGDPHKTKIHFISLGCDKNLVDGEIMAGLLEEAGYEMCADISDSQAVIVNTCGFIAEAISESIRTVLDAASHKRDGNSMKIIVAGCMAQRYKDEILKEIPEADCVIGVNDFHRIADTMGEVLGDLATPQTGKRILRVSEYTAGRGSDANEGIYMKRRLSTPGHYAHLKIAEGCDNRCSYCAIPSIRGPYRSRTFESLTEEALTLASRGVREIAVVAQDTTNYGADIYGRERLHELLRAVTNVPGIRWVRLLYAYPERITNDLIDEMSTNPKICNYIDMPIQHSSDAVLMRMGRKSLNKKIRDVIGRLRAAMPDVAIRTTLITGFPGESEKDFMELVDFIEEIKFDKLGVFAYSREDGTPAAKMPGQCPEKIKNERRETLLELQSKISLSINASQEGRKLDVITDGFLPDEGVYSGRSYRDACDTDGSVYFKSKLKLMTGDFVRVTITGASEYDLTGEAIWI